MSFFNRNSGNSDNANSNSAENTAGNSAGNSDNDSNSENNNENNLPLNTNMWDNDNNGNESNSDSSSQNSSSQGNQNVNQQQSLSPDEAMQQHIASLNLNANVDLNAISEELREGKTDALQSAFANISANTYKAAVLNTNRLMESKIAEAVESAVKQSSGTVSANLAEQEMHKLIPLTKNSDVAPIAKAVLTKMMSKSNSVEEAINGVEKFFKAISNEGVAQFKDLPANQPRPGQNPFGQSPQPKVDDNYYLDLLSGS